MARVALGEALRSAVRRPDTMLEQIRRLFLAFCLGWPLIGLPVLLVSDAMTQPLAVVVVVVGLELWWVLGYFRRAFPMWSWVFCGAAAGFVLWACGYDATLSFFFVGIGFRFLYGSVRSKYFGGVAMLVVLAVVGLLLSTVDMVIPTLFTAAMFMSIMHTLGRVATARDRTDQREVAVSEAGVALLAADTRAEAINAALRAGIRLDRASIAAAIVIGTRSTLRVAGATGPEAESWVDRKLMLDELPEDVGNALATGTCRLITGTDAATLARSVGQAPGTAALVAPLSARGACFGLLIVVFDRKPADDLTGAATSVAGQAALALDRLLAIDRLRVIVDNTPDAVVLTAADGTIRRPNPAAQRMLGRSAADLVGIDFGTLIHPEDASLMLTAWDAPDLVPRLCRIRGVDGNWLDVETVIGRVKEHDGSMSMVISGRDVSDRQRLEVELRHAQKLESVGRLAAGIAHEINTPIQFIGDNVRFLQQVFTDLLQLHRTYHDAATTTDPDTIQHTFTEARAIEDSIDIDFLTDETPQAIEQTLDGIARVATIVRAMKAFGHPSGAEKTRNNLNDAIANTLIVANNELKYVADVHTDYGNLPPVWCHLGDINQVVLNLIINAAHAITATTETATGTGTNRGTVTITTSHDTTHAIITITDTGTGIPADVVDKIFDPFFTTKPVGTGTGQGLALARSLITDRHKGTIDFTTQPGTGTTFTIRLPLTDAGVPADSYEPVGASQ